MILELKTCIAASALPDAWLCKKLGLELDKFTLSNILRRLDNIHFMAQFISRVENQSDQYGTQSPGFGGFGGLLVSGPMLLVEQTTKTFYLGRKALHLIRKAGYHINNCLIYYCGELTVSSNIPIQFWW